MPRSLLFGIDPAGKTVNRALILAEKSLTVNSFACPALSANKH